MAVPPLRTSEALNKPDETYGKPLTAYYGRTPRTTAAEIANEKKRMAFFNVYTKKYAIAKTGHLEHQLEKAQQERKEKGLPPLTGEDARIPLVPTNVFPRKYLMHALRCIGLAPTEEELAVVVKDVFPPTPRPNHNSILDVASINSGSIVTLDQFLEVCDLVRDVNRDVEADDVLSSFRNAIIASPRFRKPQPYNNIADLAKQQAASEKAATEAQCNANFDGVRGPEDDLKINSPTTQNPSSSTSPSAPPASNIVTRAQMRSILYMMTDDEFKAAMLWLDPENKDAIDLVKVSEMLAQGAELEEAEKERQEREAFEKQQQQKKGGRGSPPTTTPIGNKGIDKAFGANANANANASKRPPPLPAAQKQEQQQQRVPTANAASGTSGAGANNRNTAAAAGGGNKYASAGAGAKAAENKDQKSGGGCCIIQ